MSESSMYILLSLYDGEKHGYGVILKTREITNGEVELVTATVYSAIGRFIIYGLVDYSRENDDKKYYKITELGKRILIDEYTRVEKLKRNIESIL